MEANPFKLTEEDMAARLYAVQERREKRIAELGTHGSDGVIVDAVANAGLRGLDNTEQMLTGADSMARELGGLVLCAPRLIADKFRNKK